MTQLYRQSTNRETCFVAQRFTYGYFLFFHLHTIPASLLCCHTHTHSTTGRCFAKWRVVNCRDTQRICLVLEKKRRAITRKPRCVNWRYLKRWPDKVSFDVCFDTRTAYKNNGHSRHEFEISLCKQWLRFDFWNYFLQLWRDVFRCVPKSRSAWFRDVASR